MTTIHPDSPTEILGPTDVSNSWNRVAGFAGIAFAVLFIALGGGIAADAPVFTDGADELRSWFSDNQGPIALFTWLGPLTFGLLQLTFAAGLLRRLSVGDRSGGILPRISFAGVVANFGAGLVGMALWGVMTLDPILEGASDDVLLTVSALDSVVFFVLMPWAGAIFTIFASVLMLQTRAMPVWLAGLGFVAAVLTVIGGTWLFSGDPESGIAGIGFIAGLAGLLWTVIASVFLIRNATD